MKVHLLFQPDTTIRIDEFKKIKWPIHLVHLVLHVIQINLISLIRLFKVEKKMSKLKVQWQLLLILLRLCKLPIKTRKVVRLFHNFVQDHLLINKQPKRNCLSIKVMIIIKNQLFFQKQLP